MRYLLIGLLLLCTGCAVLDWAFPPQRDAQGNVIPGSRQPNSIVDSTADSIPYGGLAVNLLLLGLAGYEKYRANKLGKGFTATLAAGQKLSRDPKMRDLWETAKESYYRPMHVEYGVTELVKKELLKL